MLAVALVALAITIARPLLVSPAIRAARDVLKNHGSAGEPGFKLSDYQAASASMTRTGYWQVNFVRIAGSGDARKTVIVPSQAVDKYRFNPFR